MDLDLETMISEALQTIREQHNERLALQSLQLAQQLSNIELERQQMANDRRLMDAEFPGAAGFYRRCDAAEAAGFNAVFGGKFDHA
jgi:hypothetical protein